MKKYVVLAIAVLALVSSSLCAAPNASDPSLKLWLQPDNYSQAAGTWTDSSSSGVTMGILQAGEALTDPANHTPQATTATNGSKTFSAVQFRQTYAYNPIIPDPTAGHKADWLYQYGEYITNPLMNDGDLTMFVTFKAQAMAGEIGLAQTLAAIRGPVGSPYDLALFTNFGGKTGVHAAIVTYGGDVVYQSNLEIANRPDLGNTSGWGVLELKFSNSAAGTSTLTFAQNFGSGWQYSTPRNLVPRDASADGIPFGLGGHAQGIGADIMAPYGNGQYERFAGWMGDVILYNTALGGAAETDIQDYLVGKYAIPEPATLLLLGLGGILVRKWSQ
jgi:hypothetical protein